MKTFFFVGLIFFLISCGDDKSGDDKINWDQEKSVKMNKDLALEEDIQIQLYLEQHKDWKMIKTGSGLQYYIYKTSKGDSAQGGMVAQVEMNVSLLDGTECYATKDDEYEEFVIDKSNVETGIQEGIKHMAIGDRAKMIIPSHLAHGLVGDMNKIPPLTTIVVDLNLIGLVK